MSESFGDDFDVLGDSLGLNDMDFPSVTRGRGNSESSLGATLVAAADSIFGSGINRNRVDSFDQLISSMPFSGSWGTNSPNSVNNNSKHQRPRNNSLFFDDSGGPYSSNTGNIMNSPPRNMNISTFGGRFRTHRNCRDGNNSRNRNRSSGNANSNDMSVRDAIIGASKVSGRMPMRRPGGQLSSFDFHGVNTSHNNNVFAQQEMGFFNRGDNHSDNSTDDFIFQ